MVRWSNHRGVLFGALMLWSLAWFPSFVTAGDPNAMFAVAKSVAQGHLTVPCHLGVRGTDGDCYSNFYLLNSLFALPFVVVGDAISALLGTTSDKPAQLLVLLVPAMATAGTAVAIRAICTAHGAPGPAATLASVIFALGTEALVYSRTFFAEPLAAFFVSLAALYLPRPDKRWIGLGALGGIVLAKPQLIFLAVPLAIAALGRDRRGLTCALGALIAASALLATYNFARFGSLTDFGGATRGLHASALSVSHIVDAVGLLLFSPGRGLLLYSGAAVVGLLVLLTFRRGDRLASMAVSAFVGALMIAVLNPGGGVNWGTRYLLPAMPLLCAGLAFAPPAWKRAGVACAGVSFAVGLPTLLIDWQLAYRVPLANGDVPGSISWSITHGPAVEIWRALFDTHSYTELFPWWAQPTGALAVVAVVLAAAALRIAARLLLPTLRPPR